MPSTSLDLMKPAGTDERWSSGIQKRSGGRLTWGHDEGQGREGHDNRGIHPWGDPAAGGGAGAVFCRLAACHLSAASETPTQAVAISLAPFASKYETLVRTGRVSTTRRAAVNTTRRHPSFSTLPIKSRVNAIGVATNVTGREIISTGAARLRSQLRGRARGA